MPYTIDAIFVPIKAYPYFRLLKGIRPWQDCSVYRYTPDSGCSSGLGLSLTYEMVVKGHRGSIQTNSKDGES